MRISYRLLEGDCKQQARNFNEGLKMSELKELEPVVKHIHKPYLVMIPVPMRNYIPLRSNLAYIESKEETEDGEFFTVYSLGFIVQMYNMAHRNSSTYGDRVLVQLVPGDDKYLNEFNAFVEYFRKKNSYAHSSDRDIDYDLNTFCFQAEPLSSFSLDDLHV